MEHRKHEKQDCSGCRFLGYYNGHDLYFCTQGQLPTVIARYGEGSDYISGLPIAQAYNMKTCREADGSAHFSALRVAYLIAMDMGYLPVNLDVPVQNT